MGAATSSEEGQVQFDEGLENEELLAPSSPKDMFDNWCRYYGKTYSSDHERQHRLEAFKKNYDFVLKHNRAGNSTYTVALNQFSDLTDDEMACHRGFRGFLAPGKDGLMPSSAPGKDGLMLSSAPGKDVVRGFDVPASSDWRAKGAFTKVNDQGSFVVCWYFHMNL
ncbi:PREDICTED: senescence-specific cysteine protease SAG39-like [Ipomoea nil]|uniref:senescence-specific cysteine protease SAG39-like n=1 Tax=Ipomoea nil TaxID=35883 RepID=UPI0009009CE1|nr:PREDICTED: senescence-specific cysteine protease SAG39-like [Ipomoea nil]